MSDETFTQIVEFSPAFDRRSPNPREDYGIHGAELRMVLKGPEGAVHFVLYTNWMLPHVRRETHERILRHPDLIGLHCAYDPLPADLGYHSPKPMFEGHEPMGASRLDFDNKETLELESGCSIEIPKTVQTGSFTKCPYVDGPCYYDGSGLQAERIFEVLVSEGSDGVWRELRAYYDETFHGARATEHEPRI